MTYDTVRRRLLKHGIAATAITLSACRWESESASPLGTQSSEPTQPTNPAPTVVWKPAVPVMVVGSGATFDLSSTLPPEIKRGGTFAVDPSGPKLPVGMSLTPSGLLAVGSAAVGSVTDVIFTYEV